MTIEIKVYVANLGKYNEGELVGAWFTLPVDMDEVSEAIGLNDEYEEYAIHDYEAVTGINIGEYSSLERLNEIAEEIDGLNSYQLDDLELILETEEHDFDESLEILLAGRYSIYRGCINMADVAEIFLGDTGGLLEIPEHLRQYFDYEAYGDDMDSSNHHFISNNICIELHE